MSEHLDLGRLQAKVHQFRALIEAGALLLSDVAALRNARA
jgi:hypothetical protein